MKLSDLQPRWLDLDGRRVGLLFQCPHCQGFWLTCFFEKLPMHEQMRAWSRATGHPLDEDGWPDGPEGARVSFCHPNAQWQATGDLNDLTIMPSIDASAAGHWHGFIRAGMMT